MKKNFKKVVCVILVTVILMSACIFSNSKVYGAQRYIWNGIGGAKNEYEYNSDEVLDWYALFSTQKDLIPAFYIDDFDDGYACFYYDENGNKNEAGSVQAFRDGTINAADASTILALSLNKIGINYNEDGSLTEEAKEIEEEHPGSVVEDEAEYIQGREEEYQKKYINSMILSLVDGLKEDGININADDVTYRITLSRPAVEELNIPARTVEVNNDDKTVSTQYDELKTFMKENETIQKTYYPSGDRNIFYTTSLTLETKNNGTYKLALIKRAGENGGNDAWYFELVPDFHTKLTYESTPEGELDDSGTYVVTGMTDVTAIIESKNEEEIATVDGEAITTTPNSKGWYYIDANNKRKIAKVYKFSDYTGSASEEVKLVGKLTGREDTQSPSIRWKLIYKNEETDKFIEETDEFITKLTYQSEVAGKEENGTYYPQFTVNEDSNAKKDLDVTAIITSKTDEDIIKVVIGEVSEPLTDDNKSPETANKFGWYYPDVTNKKVIAKLYKFDVYDNVNDNGKVKETVKVIGAKGGESTEVPSIEWTFRRINKSQVENPNGTTTVTITYNLPVDKNSIPQGWEPVYDDDNVTIHAIKRVFAKGEKYDKDVIVSQNGNPNKKVTTHVKVGKDTADNLGPQAGVFSVIFVIAIAGVAVLSVIKYRRIKK